MESSFLVLYPCSSASLHLTKSHLKLVQSSNWVWFNNFVVLGSVLWSSHQATQASCWWEKGGGGVTVWVVEGGVKMSVVKTISQQWVLDCYQRGGPVSVLYSTWIVVTFIVRQWWTLSVPVNLMLSYVDLLPDLPVGRTGWSVGKGVLCDKIGSSRPNGLKARTWFGAGVLQMGGCAGSVHRSKHWVWL